MISHPPTIPSQKEGKRRRGKKTAYMAIKTKYFNLVAIG
jgi:hypothetical protein